MFKPRVWPKPETPREALLHVTLEHVQGGPKQVDSFYWKANEAVLTDPEYREESFQVLLNSKGIKQVNVTNVQLVPVPVILPLPSGVEIGLTGLDTVEAK
jgi:hypothetical protein